MIQITRRMTRNKLTCFLNVFLFNSVTLFVFVDGRVVMDKPLFREILHKLETRFVDLRLLRQELYQALDAASNKNIRDGTGIISTVTRNINSQDIDSEITNIRQELLDTLNSLRNGFTDEKRIRRSIQSDSQSFLDNDTTNMQLSASGSQNMSDIFNVLEKLQRDVETIAKIVQTNFRNKESRVSDCTEWYRLGHTVSGVYTVYPQSLWRPLKVYCDMETDGGGWTVFQRRVDGSENFQRNWMNYTFGFGNLSGEFWLGTEFVHHLTSSGPHELRIDMEDFQKDARVAKYGLFSVGPRSGGFVLNADFFTGNVKDSLIVYHQNQQFNTYDKQNEVPSVGCIEPFKGGWWYPSCYGASFNGFYPEGNYVSFAEASNWHTPKGYYVFSLKKTEMKIRPR